MKKAIEVCNLTKKFGDFVAVNNINLIINEAEVFGLLGPNGAGKSTIIKMLCGLLKPTSGWGYVAGCDIIKDFDRIKRSIGYMSQKFSLYENLTVEENIDFYCGIYRLNRKEKKAQKDWAFETAEIMEYRNQIVAELPKGYKQRLALVCALLHKPRILFLDEPTAGVDPISRQQFWDLIYRLKDSFRTTALVTTHYMDEAERCERIALIQNGIISVTGTFEELKDLIKDKVYLIKAQPYFTAREALQAEPGIHRVLSFGNSFHAFFAEDADIEVVKHNLKKKNVDILSFMPIRPSLEDVFLSVMEK